MKRSNARKFKWLRRRFSQISSDSGTPALIEQLSTHRGGYLRWVALLLLVAITIFVPSAIIPTSSAIDNEGPIATNDANHLWPRFSPETIIQSQTGGQVSNAAIAVDPRNNAHVVWTLPKTVGGYGHPPEPQTIRYSGNRWDTRTANGWITPVDIFSETTIDYITGRTAVAALHDGKILFVWSKRMKSERVGGNGVGNTDLFYRTYDPSTNILGTVGRLTTGYYEFDISQNAVVMEKSYSSPRLVTDNNGDIHILYYWYYYTGLAPFFDYREVMYRKWSATTQQWSAEDGIPGTFGDISIEPAAVEEYRIATDTSSAPHAVWTRNDGSAQYNTSVGGAWQNPVNVDTDTYGGDLAVDAQNTVHFAIAGDSTNTVRYRRRLSNGTFGPLETVSQETYPYIGPIEIGLHGNLPQIIWKGGNLCGYGARTTTEWHTQEPLFDLPNFIFSEATKNSHGTFYMVYDTYGTVSYSRTLEPNLGAQDGMATFGMGPNTSANAATGNLMTTLPVFSSRGVGFATSFALTYNSLDPDSGVLSQGWQYNYQMTLTDHNTAPIPTDPPPTDYSPWKLSLKFGDGHSVVFPYDPARSYYVADTEYGFPARIERSESEYLMTTKSAIRYTFNTAGKLREIKDTNNNTLTLAYTDGLLTSITDSAGRVTTLAYNANKQLQTITDPAPNSRTYTLSYNGSKKLSKLAFDSASGTDWELDYYVNDNFDYGERVNLLKTVKTPRENVTLFAYQPDNRILKSTDPLVEYMDDAGATQTESLSRTIAYTDLDHKATFTNRRGKNTTVEFLQRYALVTKATDAKGFFVTRAFDNANLNRNLLSFTDKKGNITSYTYAPATVPSYVNDNLATITRPGVATPIAYTYTADGLNRVDTVTDSKGALTDYNYDSAGNLAGIVYPAAPISQNGEPEQTLTSSESFLYDGYGRMYQSTNADDIVTFYEIPDPTTGLFTRTHLSGLQPDDYTYDKMGNTTQHTDPQGTVTRYELDNLYRVDWVKSAYGTADELLTDYGYDLDSNTTTVADPKKTMTYTINAIGRQTKIENSQLLGKSIDYWYDQEGNNRKVKDYEGHITQTTYNELGQVKDEILPGPPQITTTYLYDNNGNVESVTRNGKITSYGYDERNNQKTVTYPTDTGLLDTSYVDDNDNHKGTIQSKGGVFVYGSKSAHDARGRTQESQQLSSDPGAAYMKGDSVVVGNGPVTSYSYKHGGDRTSVTDADSHTTVSLNDPYGRPEKTKDSSGIIVSKTSYYDNGQVYEQYIQNPAVPNPSGDGAANLMMASRAVYNVLGQVKERYDAQLNKTEYFYEDANKNLTKTIDAEGHVVEMHYNNLDQMDWKKEYLSYPSSFVLTQFTYDDNGNMKTVVDPRLKTYTYNYDASSRLVSIAYPIAGHTESWVYNEDGNLFTHTDPNGKVATYTYDDLGRAIAEHHGAPYNVTITRTYEDDLHRVTVTDGNISKVMETNTLNRLTGVQYKIGGIPWKSVGYSYFANGNRQTMTDPEGALYEYNYTPNDQLASISRNSSFAIQNSYDSGGRKIRSDLGNGTSMRYTYDNKERVTNVKALRSQGDVVSSFSYVYNKIDNRTQMKIDHDNVLVNYGYDGVSRLTSESWNLGTANSSCNNQYTAQPQGNESGFSNVAKATPSAGILTSPFLSYYTYDSAGNRTAKYRLDGGSSYAVDDENRLTTEQPFSVQALTPVTTTTQDNWVELDFGALVAPFRLDVALPDMNRRFKIQWHDGASYQDISSRAALGATLEQDGYYRPFSQDCRFLFVSIATQKIRYWQESGSSAGVSLAAYTIVNGAPIAYGYDANGNQTSRTQGTSVETYAHDYANRIVTYSDQQVAYNYIFAPSGERMAKVNPDLSSEWYMYDGDDVVADYAKPSGGAYSLAATYANGLGIDTKIARYDPSGAPSYYIPDALGSVHRILDGAQNVVNTYLTNAWGESLISQEGIPNRYGFTQRERDGESSLMHYRARSYDPRLGRFTQRDPLGMVDGPNMHVYAKNNPVLFSDPTGFYSKARHKVLTNEVLKGIGYTDVKSINVAMDANASVDDDQSAEGAYKHAMVGTLTETRTAVWVPSLHPSMRAIRFTYKYEYVRKATEDEAVAMATHWMKEQIAKAVDSLQRSTSRDGVNVVLGYGYIDDYFTAVGRLHHTVQDSHVHGYKEWLPGFFMSYYVPGIREGVGIFDQPVKSQKFVSTGIVGQAEEYVFSHGLSTDYIRSTEEGAKKSSAYFVQEIENQYKSFLLERFGLNITKANMVVNDGVRTSRGRSVSIE